MIISLTIVRRILLPLVAGLFLAWGFAALSSYAADTTPVAQAIASMPVNPIPVNLGDRPSSPPQPLPEWLVQVPPIAQPQMKQAHPVDRRTQAHPTNKATPATATTKSIAIDAADGSSNAAPNVVEMDEVQVAARIWASASFPVEQFQAYTSPFGYRSSPTGGYRQEFHYGLDIAAPQRSYIRNWWAGTVIEVSDGSNCGTSVVIQSGEWTHMYCHMQGHVASRGGTVYLVDQEGGIELRQGQQIAAGDRIGRVGMTGRTTGPHLHWGLKYQSNWVDPAWVLQAMAASYHALYGQ